MNDTDDLEYVLTLLRTLYVDQHPDQRSSAMLRVKEISDRHNALSDQLVLGDVR